MNNSDPYKIVRRLIWLYFFLLVFEGAIRKWILPGFSNAMLIVRDPVVILIYFAAIATRCFPLKNVWVITLLVLAIASFFGGFLATRPNLLVMTYGLRTNFLHLPLIFLMGRVLTAEDLKRLGKWILIVSIPMALLMVAQFRGGKGHWLNVTAGGTGTQLWSVADKVRASGTFSFITGPVSFYALVAVFLLFGQVKKKVYPIWLNVTATVTLLIASAASGSRSLLAAVIIVGAAFLTGLLLHPPSMARAFRVVLYGAMAYLLVDLLDVFREAAEMMQKRIEFAAQGKSQLQMVVERLRGTFYLPVFTVPVFGHGLGLGTNAGAALLGVRGRFLLAENEWQRIVMESGFVLGPAFILFRVALFFRLAFLSLGQARSGNLLCILLLGASSFLIVNGQFGPPTILGFAVFTAGCCLAAANTAEERTGVVAREAIEPDRPPRKARVVTEPVRGQVNGSREVARRPANARPSPQPGRWTVRPDSVKNDVS